MHAHTLDGDGAHAQTIVHPVIVINGQVLSNGQAYALRVAVTQFRTGLQSWCRGPEQLSEFEARYNELDAIWMAPTGQHAHQVVQGPHSHNAIHCHGSHGHWGRKP